MPRSKGKDHSVHASDAEMAGILSISVDAIITVDSRQRITRLNHGAETIFGYGAGEMLGRPLELLLPERFRGAHAKHIVEFAGSPEGARRMGDRAAISGLRKDLTEFPAEASILKLAVDGETSFTVVLRDVTDRKRTEEAQRLLADAGGVLNRTLD